MFYELWRVEKSQLINFQAYIRDGHKGLRQFPPLWQLAPVSLYTSSNSVVALYSVGGVSVARTVIAFLRVSLEGAAGSEITSSRCSCQRVTERILVHNWTPAQICDIRIPFHDYIVATYKRFDFRLYTRVLPVIRDYGMRFHLNTSPSCSWWARAFRLGSLCWIYRCETERNVGQKRFWGRIRRL